MATREDVYCKFGLAAEAGQLFETELGTLLLFAKGLKGGWHISPKPDDGLKLLRDIEKQTLGRLLGNVKDVMAFDEGLEVMLAAALKARNRLNHGFFERHHFRIQTDDGRDMMWHELEELHTEMFEAWQVVSAMTKVCLSFMTEQQETASPKD